MKLTPYILSCFLIGCMTGCSPSSLEEYYYEGESLGKELLRDLESIQTAADLYQNQAKLKKRFKMLVKLMIAAKEYELSHKEEELSFSPNRHMSEALKKEFIRIYQIEGCQEMMENLQRESLHKLSRFDHEMQTYRN